MCKLTHQLTNCECHINHPGIIDTGLVSNCVVLKKEDFNQIFAMSIQVKSCRGVKWSLINYDEHYYYSYTYMHICILFTL